MQDGQNGQFDQPTNSPEHSPTINDERILNVPVEENREPLVNIFGVDEKYRHRLLLPQDERLSFRREDLADTPTPFVRKEVLTKLIQVLDTLPENIGIVVIEPYRSYEDQQKLFAEKVKELIDSGSSQDEAKKEATKYVSDPDTYSPHVTGGPIDIGLVDLTLDNNNKIQYLDMGNWFIQEASAAMDYPQLSEAQKNNRLLLKRVMEAAGFVNYPYEWWHWSIGDKYWAYVKHEPNAIYGSVDAPNI